MISKHLHKQKQTPLPSNEIFFNVMQRALKDALNKAKEFDMHMTEKDILNFDTTIFIETKSKKKNCMNTDMNSYADMGDYDSDLDFDETFLDPSIDLRMNASMNDELLQTLFNRNDSVLENSRLETRPTSGLSATSTDLNLDIGLDLNKIVTGLGGMNNFLKLKKF